MKIIEPLISVLIPVYNVEKFVLAAVDCIIKQTYTNLEIIIVDDASTDNTYELLKTIAKSDSRIKLFRNTENSKIVKTLNFAFSKSHGEYIARMDGDDLCCYDRLEKQLTFLKNHLKIDIVGNHVYGIDEKENEISKHYLFTEEEKINKSILISSPLLHIWLAKREVYSRLNGYRIQTAEDYDFLLRAKTEGFHMINMNEFLYSVRHRDGNTSSTQGLIQRKSFRYVKKLFKERLVTGFDSYSEEDLLKNIHSNKFVSSMHKLSSFFMNKSFKNKKSNVFLFVFYLMLSICCSFYTLEYVVSSLKLKIMHLK